MALLATILALTVPHTPAYPAAEACNTQHGGTRWTRLETRCAVRRAFHGTGHMRDALAVAECESRFNAYSVNRGSGAAGVYQIIPRFHWDAPNVFDPAAVARWVRQVTRGGTRWHAWVCQP